MDFSGSPRGNFTFKGHHYEQSDQDGLRVSNITAGCAPIQSVMANWLLFKVASDPYNPAMLATSGAEGNIMWWDTAARSCHAFRHIIVDSRVCCRKRLLMERLEPFNQNETFSTTSLLTQDPWGLSVCYGQGYDWSAGDLWGGTQMSSEQGNHSLRVTMWNSLHHSEAFHLLGCQTQEA